MDELVQPWAGAKKIGRFVAFTNRQVTDAAGGSSFRYPSQLGSVVVVVLQALNATAGSKATEPSSARTKKAGRKFRKRRVSRAISG